MSAPTGVWAPEGPVEREFWGLRSLDPGSGITLRCNTMVLISRQMPRRTEGFVVARETDAIDLWRPRSGIACNHELLLHSQLVVKLGVGSGEEAHEDVLPRLRPLHDPCVARRIELVLLCVSLRFGWGIAPAPTRA